MEGKTGARRGGTSRSVRSFLRRRKGILLLGAFLIAAGAVATVAYGVVEARRLDVVRYDIRSRDLPPAFDGVQIAFLVDVHRGPFPFLSGSQLDSLVAQVEAMKPDLVILGGDNVYHFRDELSEAYDALGRIRAPLGVFGVMGNHDHYNGEVRAREEMARVGIRDLDNTAVWVERGGERILLGGIEDLYEEGEADAPNLGPTLAASRPQDFVLLVSHQPDIVPDLPPGRIDLVLSGHLHGGQVTLFGWAPVLPSKYGQRYRTGLVQGGPAPVIVSNGIGTITLPIRLFAPPELVMVRLFRAS